MPIPFKNYTEHISWLEDNCAKCKKYIPEESASCSHRVAIGFAMGHNEELTQKKYDKVFTGEGSPCKVFIPREYPLAHKVDKMEDGEALSYLSSLSFSNIDRFFTFKGFAIDYEANVEKNINQYIKERKKESKNV